MILLVLLSIGTLADAKNSSDSNLCETLECQKTADYFLGSMDASVDPCQDFYHFACGGWIKKAKIPPGKLGYSRFSEVRSQVEDDFRKLLESDQLGDDNYVKIYYEKCVKPQEKEEGVSELIQMVRDIMRPVMGPENQGPADGLALLLGASRRISGQSVLLSPERLTDGRKYHLNFRQPNLGLGPPSKYLNKTQNKKAQKLYLALLVPMAKGAASLFNLSTDPKELAQKVYDFEAKVASFIQPRTKIRDPFFTYNVVPLGEVKKNFSFVNWDLWIKTLMPDFLSSKYNDETTVNIQSPPFVQGINDLVSKTDPLIVRLYILSQVVIRASEFNVNIPAIKVALNRLRGVKEKVPIKQACLTATLKNLDKHLAGILYVLEHFKPQDRVEPEKMVGFLKDQMVQTLKNAKFFDNTTRARSLEKLKNMVVNVGFPDFYLNGTQFQDWQKGLVLSQNDSAFKVAQKVAAWKPFVNFYRDLFSPVDQKNDWFIGPRWVTAYNDLEGNYLLFPAGLLRVPFYSPTQPAVLNFGAVGSVIGHEITHGFDDMGKAYGPYGNIGEWMSEESLEAFNSKKRCFQDQYSQYRAPGLPDVVPNVNITIGEDIADNGGVKNSFAAFQNFAAAHPELDDMVLPGMANFTKEQTFFLGWANFHCVKYKESAIPGRLRRSVHSYQPFRVRGPLSNMPEFAKAYQCAPGTPMNPTERCSLW